MLKTVKTKTKREVKTKENLQQRKKTKEKSNEFIGVKGIKLSRSLFLIQHKQELRKLLIKHKELSIRDVFTILAKKETLPFAIDYAGTTTRANINKHLPFIKPVGGAIQRGNRLIPKAVVKLRLKKI